MRASLRCSLHRRVAGPDDDEIGVERPRTSDRHAFGRDAGSHPDAREQPLGAIAHDEHEARRRLDGDDAVEAVADAHGIARVELPEVGSGLAPHAATVSAQAASATMRRTEPERRRTA